MNRDCFQTIVNEADGKWSSEDKAKAQGFLNKFEDFEFLFLLNVFTDIFSSTDHLYNVLQKKNLNIGYSGQAVKNCTSELAALRTDAKFDALYDDRVDVEPPAKRVKRRPGRLQDYFADSTSVADESGLSIRDRKKRLYFEIVDTVKMSIGTRFGDIEELKFCSIFTGDHSPSVDDNPAVESFMSGTYRKFFDKEGLLDDLRYFRLGALPTDLNKLVADMFELQLSSDLPQLDRLARLALTIPVVSASAERSFSNLKRIKTRLRNTMGDQRLSNLAMMAINVDIVESLSSDEIINRFASKKSRRIELIYK